MLKRFWQKIKQNHLLMMAICCLAPILLVIGFLSLYQGTGNYWIWLIILLCPLMHIFMMKDIMKEYQHSNSCEQETKKMIYKCPECGLEYKEKELAKKCQAWCKEHKSCNLKITKHAIKKLWPTKKILKNL